MAQGRHGGPGHARCCKSFVILSITSSRMADLYMQWSWAVCRSDPYERSRAVADRPAFLTVGRIKVACAAGFASARIGNSLVHW